MHGAALSQSKCLSLRLTLSFVAFFTLILTHSQTTSSVALRNAFAHNDYWHDRPLLDALDNGFTHIEADIYLKKEKLIVTHMLPYFKGKKTLERIYLQPLVTYINEHDGQLFEGYDHPIILMIDIKNHPIKAYEQLKSLLKKYQPILTHCRNDKMYYGQVTVVLSGKKPIAKIKNETDRYMFLDEDLRNMKDEPNSIAPMASCKFSKLIKWNGEGEMPRNERRKLCSFVEKAHKLKKEVRLWSTPENKAVWAALLNCGVDLINTDKLVALKEYLLRELKLVTKAD